MKISFEFDDDNPMLEIMDAAFVGYMKKELQSTKQMLNDSFVHPDDVKMNKKMIKAFKLLIKHYGGSNDSVSDA